MKKFLTILLAVAMCFTLGFAVACKGKKPVLKTSIDLLNQWDVNTDEDSPYTLAPQVDGSMKITYEKSGGTWPWIRRLISIEDEETLKTMNTLVMEAKMTASSNDPRITLKLEYVAGIAAKEVHVDMSGTLTTYEWDLSNAQLDKATRLLIFCEGARATGTGELNITKMYLTKDAINPANSVEKEKPVVETVVNEITATAKTANGGWYDNGDGVYTITKNNSEYNVAYNKRSSEWASLYALVKGAAISDYKSLHVTIKGTEGEDVLVKPFDNGAMEKRVTLTGGDDVIKADISTVGSVEGLDLTKDQKILIFAQPGQMDKTGSFVIKNVEFSTEVLEKEVKVENEITATSKKANAAWYDLFNKAYTVTKNEDGTFNVAYAKVADTEWHPVVAYVKGAALADMKSVKITVRGTEGVAVMFKGFDLNTTEKRFTLTGGDDVIEIDISAVTAEQREAKPFIGLLILPGEATGSGTLTIKDLEFSENEVQGEVVEKVENEITATNKSFNNGWYDGGDGKYTVTKTDSTVNVEKAAGGSWSSLKVDVKGAGLTSMKSVKLVVKGTAGDVILVKPFDNGACETKMALTGGNDVVFCDVSSVAATLSTTNALTILVFYNFEGAGEGKAASYSILSADFSEEAINTISATATSVNAGWYNNSDSVYTVTKSGDNYTVAYDKGNLEYPALKANVKGDFSAMKSLKLTVSGTAGKHIILKPYDIKEVNVELGAGDTEVVIDLTDIAASAVAVKPYIFIMIEPGTQNVTGTFTIKGLEYSKLEVPGTPITKAVQEITATNKSFNDGWYDGGDGVFHLSKRTDNKVVVVKDGNADKAWATMRVGVKGAAIATMNTVKLVVKGESGVKMTVKPFDNGACESAVTLTGGEDIIVCDISSASSLDFTTEQTILVFFNWDDSNKANSASCLILSAEFSAQKVSKVGASSRTVDSWHDVDGGVYTLQSGNDGISVSKIAGHGWAALRAGVVGAGSNNLTTLKVTLSGVRNVPIIVGFMGIEVKFENANLPTEDTVVAVIDFSSKANTNNLWADIALFIGFTDDVAANALSFKIVSAEFVANVNTITTENKSVGGWFDSGVNAYAITEADGVYTVVKTVNSSNQWASIRANVTGEAIKTMKTVHVVVSTSADVQVKVQPFDMPASPVAAEKVVNGNNVEIICDISSVAAEKEGVQQIAIYMGWDATENVTITINSVTFSTEEAPAA